MGLVASRFDVWLVSLDPTLGAEIMKTRPAVIISPDEMNRHLNTVIIAPMTTTIRGYPTRIKLKFKGKHGEIALDQIRAIDKSRLIERIGAIDKKVTNQLFVILQEMFSE